MPTRGAAYEAYTSYYLSTSGQRYWSDTNQLSVYIDDYHAELDRRLRSPHKCTEMITELYVPRTALPEFLAAARADFRRHGVQLIYGTIRLIERDDESFLAWAREPWACIVMNLHVEHTEDGVRKAAADFRRLIDRAVAHGGSYFLTYHRWANRAQVEACYPQMPAFLRLKRQLRPGRGFPERLVPPLQADVRRSIVFVGRQHRACAAPGTRAASAETLRIWNSFPSAACCVELRSPGISAHISAHMSLWARWHGSCEIIPGLGKFPCIARVRECACRPRPRSFASTTSA